MLGVVASENWSVDVFCACVFERDVGPCEESGCRGV